jgi:hypothetical protein
MPLCYILNFATDQLESARNGTLIQISLSLIANSINMWTHFSHFNAFKNILKKMEDDSAERIDGTGAPSLLPLDVQSRQ